MTTKTIGERLAACGAGLTAPASAGARVAFVRPNGVQGTAERVLLAGRQAVIVRVGPGRIWMNLNESGRLGELLCNLSREE